jgi:N-acetylgalactosamine-N,N'-diacetylbacillosaminyl-diphospho-undecaprenol 4-alpha-N-acetylgalactosaminyltransferase
VLSLLAGANLVNVLSRQKERVIVSERTLTSFFIKSIWEVALEKFILRKADCVVALSEVVRLDLIQKFKIDKNKVVTIYNSVALDKFCFDSSVEERDQDSPLIVTMGRLTHQKAQWHLFRAFPQVLKVFPGARLVVLGQGQLRDAYGDFLQKLGIDRQTELKGFLPNPHSVIRTADVFAFTSMVEGLGNALLEALACGKAVVSTDCDAGPREILAPETNPLTKTKIIEYAQYGVLVPATSNDVFDRNVIAPSQEETLLAEAIIRLLEDRSLRRRYEEKARERVADFSPAVITHGWVDVIEKD